jgi:DNA adenine methylase
MFSTINNNTKPFLRWAGGKNWLVKHLNEILNIESFNNYHEPFLGGGSIFFNLQNDQKSYLSDLNSKLVNTYIEIRDNVEAVIEELKNYKNSKEFYYYVRNEKYNLSYKCAAQFIFLNQTSFNGIYRENLKGEYNVPYGYRKKNFFEPENLRLVSLKLANANIFTSDFESILENISQKDLVFLDPPYTVSHNKNGFIKYNKNLFSLDDQYRLKDFTDKINSKGAYYILTNAAHATIKEIFDSHNKLYEMSRASLIGGTNANRGIINEYLFTNI